MEFLFRAPIVGGEYWAYCEDVREDEERVADWHGKETSLAVHGRGDMLVPECAFERTKKMPYSSVNSKYVETYASEGLDDDARMLYELQ
ncbi:hypothetical protein GJ744_009847 [Endocarpon pusillum]|uniref:Uncharacterized protein n=1 Tax=Endocarpon pusillum TaxID=364733 RepID=A0A8H7AUU5_9EURO|nr:hypothetical protein GJ744_009847 [Endocarpon pusillum]